MTGNTGLLTTWCNPFGTEGDGDIQLAGGLFPASQVGKYIWNCGRRAEAVYQMICTGGEYGFARTPGQGIVAAYHCPGGHKGHPMPLCRLHAREFQKGPDEPRWSKDLTTAFGQIGGTVANKLCPPCAAPAEARTLMEQAAELHQRMSMYVAMGLDLSAPFLAMQSQADQISAAMDEMNERGIIHKCPLILREVS